VELLSQLSWRYEQNLPKGQPLLTKNSATIQTIVKLAPEDDIRVKLLAQYSVRIVRPLSKSLEQQLSLRSDRLDADGFGLLDADSIDKFNHLIAQSSIIWEHYGIFAVIEISPGILIKVGTFMDTSFVSDLDYVRKYAPGVKFPEVLGIFKSGHFTYMFMPKAEGVSLDKLWPNISTAQKMSVRNQLHPIFTELRKIPFLPDDSGSLSLGGGIPRRCRDQRRNMDVAEDAILTEGDFNKFITSSERGGEGSADQKMLLSFLRSDHDIVFTHGDLHPRNIMVKYSDQASASADLIITSLIDWEVCGWYPSYWEYVKALQTASPHNNTADWWLYLPTEAIGSCGSDFAVDDMISIRLK
jgi:hypothetical protein